MNIRSSFEALDKQFTAYGGLIGGGITRLLYSDEWQQAVHALKETLESAGFDATFDDIGNLTGRLEGSKYPDEKNCFRFSY